MFERFTRQARDVVRGAEAEARHLGADAIGSEHLLLAAVERTGAWLFIDPPGLSVVHIAAVVREPITTATIRAFLSKRDPDAAALAAIGISLAQVRRTIEETFGPDAWESSSTPHRRLPFTNEAKSVLELSLREALELRTRRITAHEILLAALRHYGEARRVVVALGASPDDAYARLRESLDRMARLVRR